LGPEFTNKDDINNTVFSSFARVGGVVTCNLYAMYAGEDVISVALSSCIYLSIYLSISILRLKRRVCLPAIGKKTSLVSLNPRENLNPVRKKRKKKHQS